MIVFVSPRSFPACFLKTATAQSEPCEVAYCCRASNLQGRWSEFYQGRPAGVETISLENIKCDCYARVWVRVAVDRPPRGFVLEAE